MPGTLDYQKININCAMATTKLPLEDKVGQAGIKFC